MLSNAGTNANAIVNIVGLLWNDLIKKTVIGCNTEMISSIVFKKCTPKFQ